MIMPVQHTSETVILSPGEDGLLHLPVLNGGLLKVPVYEAHFRGSNYVAIIDVDGTCPGGLSRRFIDRGKGAVLYMLGQVGALDVMEFAGDYTTSVGKKKRNRVYGVVVAKTPTELTVKPFEDAVDACLEAARLRAERDKVNTTRALPSDWP
jgi:hypothetical protein